MQEQVYSGLLKFNYFNGQVDVSENIHVHDTTTTADLIPELLNRFLPGLESHIDTLEGSRHPYVALVQGESKLIVISVIDTCYLAITEYNFLQWRENSHAMRNPFRLHLTAPPRG